MSEKIFIQYDVGNKQLKEANEKLWKENEKVETRNEKVETRNENVETRSEEVEMTNENKQFKKNNIVKEEPKEIKSPNWFDKNKFKEILAIIDSNEFNYKNKIGEFKYDDIKDLVNNISNNTISEIVQKKDLNALNKIKNVEIIKYKKGTPRHKKLLNLCNDLLDIILTDKTLESGSQENENENEKVESRKEENEKIESRKEENEKVESKKEENEDYEMEIEYEKEDDD